MRLFVGYTPCRLAQLKLTAIFVPEVYPISQDQQLWASSVIVNLNKTTLCIILYLKWPDGAWPVYCA